MSYLFTPNFRTGKGAKVVMEELIYLMGKFTVIMGDPEFSYLPKNLKEHFTHIEGTEQQGERQASPELAQGRDTESVSEPTEG